MRRKEACVELDNKQAYFVALMRESENYLIEDLIFQTTKTDFFVRWLRRLRFFNILPLFPFFFW